MIETEKISTDADKNVLLASCCQGTQTTPPKNLGNAFFSFPLEIIIAIIQSNYSHP
jgi:hypothetical protein